MSILLFLSGCMIPLVMFAIVVWGLLNHVDIFDAFVDGAKDGMLTVYKILPTLIGLMVGIGILRESGGLSALARIVSPLAGLFHFPGELVSLVIVKMFSSSAATSLLLDVYKQFGTDSYLGVLASVLMSCSETIFYTVSVYFVTAKVAKTRFTIPGGLLATLAGIVASVLLVKV